ERSEWTWSTLGGGPPSGAFRVTVVPEPSATTLAIIGLLGMLRLGFKKRTPCCPSADEIVQPNLRPQPLHKPIDGRLLRIRVHTVLGFFLDARDKSVAGLGFLIL